MNSINASLIRILDGQKNTPKGAGVLISGNNILTCAHVIEPLRKKGDIIYFDFPLFAKTTILSAKVAVLFSVRDKPSETPEDICILEILSELPQNAKRAVFLNPKENLNQRSVKVFGFPEDTDDGLWVEAKLKDPNTRGWMQMDHELTSKGVSPGFSGAPVWDQLTQLAAGIIVSRFLSEGKISAFMIPVSILAKACPEIIPQVTGWGKDAEKTCNRRKEIDGFSKHFSKSCCEYPNLPQIYFLPGNEDECHFSLIKRFQNTYITDFIKDKFDKSEKSYLSKLIWQKELSRQTLCEELFKLFENKPKGPYSISDFMSMTERLELKKYKVVILVHEIYADSWNSHSESLMKWYLSEFWGEIRCNKNMPLFLLFMNLIYPDSNRLIDRFKWILFKKQRMWKSIYRINTAINGKCRSFIFTEMKGITKVHVRAWLSDLENYLVKNGHEIDEYEKLTDIGDIFKGREFICMKKVEEILKNIVDKISMKLSGLHQEAKEML